MQQTGQTSGPTGQTPGPTDKTPGPTDVTPTQMQSSTPKGITGFTPSILGSTKPTTASVGYMPYLLKSTTPPTGGRKQHAERGLFEALRSAFV